MPLLFIIFMKSSYYDILEVAHTATIAEIKQAYRRLALLYHPDRNATEEGKQKFLEITEAYHVLVNSELRHKYDQLLLFGSDVAGYAVSANAKRRENSQKPNRQKTREEIRKRVNLLKKRRNAAFHKNYIGYARWVCTFVAIFVGLLLTDFVLPADVYVEKVEVRFKTMQSSATDIVKTHRFEIPVNQNFLSGILQAGIPVQIEISPLFRIVRRVNIRLDGHTYTTTPYYSIYGSYFFLVVLLLLLSGGGLVIRHDDDMVISLGFASAFFFLLVFFLLLF